VPSSQDDAQEAEPGALNFPTSQLMHASLLADEYLPATHSSQTDAPVLLFEPAAHGVQDDDLAALKVPAVQLSHESKFVALFFPLSQTAHFTAPVGE
jgi:hypothetical protein